MRPMTELNVSNISCDVKHGMIFKQYEELNPGESFILINDHDPKPLITQFISKHGEEFEHEYLLKGPNEWKLKFSKKNKKSCCGCCE